VDLKKVRDAGLALEVEQKGFGWRTPPEVRSAWAARVAAWNADAVRALQRGLSANPLYLEVGLIFNRIVPIAAEYMADDVNQARSLPGQTVEFFRQLPDALEKSRDERVLQLLVAVAVVLVVVLAARA
jgi:hypothetical protein